jgi:hypothetical protein
MLAAVYTKRQPNIEPCRSRLDAKELHPPTQVRLSSHVGIAMAKRERQSWVDGDQGDDGVVSAILAPLRSFPLHRPTTSLLPRH